MTMGRGAVLRQFGTLFTVGTLGAQSDRQLLEQFRDGQDGGEVAFETLVARHGPMVLAICRRLVGDRHEADDAFQATFLILARRASSIRKEESLAPWLFGVARRVASRARADVSRRREREQADPGLDAHIVPFVDPAVADRRTTVLDEIARLPERYRAPMVLCELEGHTHQEAAQRLNCPIGTVSGRLSRARNLLRDRLERRGLAGIGPLLAPCWPTRDLVSRTARAALGQVSPGLQASRLARWTVASFWAKGAAALASVSALAASFVGFVVLSRPASVSSTNTQAPPVVASAQPERPRAIEEVKPKTLAEHKGLITTLAFAPDGLTLASGDRGAVVRVWDLATGLETRTLLGHTGPIAALSFAPDGKTLASASLDRTLKLWDLATGRERLTVTWLPPADARPLALGSGSSGPGRNGTGRDRRASGPARPVRSDA